MVSRRTAGAYIPGCHTQHTGWTAYSTGLTGLTRYFFHSILSIPSIHAAYGAPGDGGGARGRRCGRSGNLVAGAMIHSAASSGQTTSPARSRRLPVCFSRCRGWSTQRSLSIAYEDERREAGNE
jgi:hypothetical protein